MKTVSTIAGDFDAKRFSELRREYEKAKDLELEQFQFEGEILLTSFAKYLLEYLTTQFT